MPRIASRPLQKSLGAEAVAELILPKLAEGCLKSSTRPWPRVLTTTKVNCGRRSKYIKQQTALAMIDTYFRFIDQFFPRYASHEQRSSKDFPFRIRTRFAELILATSTKWNLR